MSFAPFDTSLIVERLRSAVPDLHRIGGAADYGAVEKLSGFRTPSAYVIFAEEDNTGRVPTSPGVCAQESAVQFGVVLALRHYAEQRVEQLGRHGAGVLDAALVLTIDPAYFRLKGGIERWLYRLVRKHGGRQEHGWQFDFRHLHRKSGSAARFSDFAYDLRVLVARQSLPGYVLGIEAMPDEGLELLTFRPVLHTARG